MSAALHPSATQHLPPFITPPGESDVLMNVTIVVLVVIVLIAGNLYLRLHALPERMAHRANLVQFEIVAVLALLALLTHNNILWVAALLLALIRIPDFSTPLVSMADSLNKLAAGVPRLQEPTIEAMANAKRVLEEALGPTRGAQPAVRSEPKPMRESAEQSGPKQTAKAQEHAPPKKA